MKFILKCIRPLTQASIKLSPERRDHQTRTLDNNPQREASGWKKMS